MKISRLYLLLSLMCLICIPQIKSQEISCDFQVPIDLQLVTETSNIQPGQVVCISSGFRDFIQFRNLHGTVQNPITITNNEGVVLINSTGFYGIKFNNCSHIKLSGDGFNAVPYGIIISEVSNGTGISIDNLSTDIEIEYIEVANTSIGGLYAKTEPDPDLNCTFPATREKFTMYNTIIHDCYFHNIGDEGFYIGSSKYMGQTIAHCNDTVVLPHVLVGVKVYNNIMEKTGWDAIQVSSAISDCGIYNNLIIEDSYKEEQFQMSGIIIGGGSNCDCYNNIIRNGKGDGIEYLGVGGNRIFNNVIARAGLSYHPNDSSNSYQKHGIWIGDVFTKPDKSLYIYNNTIVSPRNFGLKIYNNSLVENYFQNNIVCNPMAYQSPGNNPYYNLDYGSSSIVDNNNYFTLSCEDMLFINPAGNNFDIKLYSPAINAGMDMSSMDLTFDALDRPRPVGGSYDIGAYEFQLLGMEENKYNARDISQFQVYPNPFIHSLEIAFLKNGQSWVQIDLYNHMGQIIKKLVNQTIGDGKFVKHIELDGIVPGIYTLKIKSKTTVFNYQIIKL